MPDINNEKVPGKNPGPKKILLGVLPYWAPVLPPVGLTRLKSFLQPHGYKIKIVDFIVKNETLEFYYGYFDVLKNLFPKKKVGILKTSAMMSCETI